MYPPEKFAVDCKKRSYPNTWTGSTGTPVKLTPAYIRGIGAAAALAAPGFILTADEVAMSMFSNPVLFSRVEGVVTGNGSPVKGAEIVQSVIYKVLGEVPPVAGPGRALPDRINDCGRRFRRPGQVNRVPSAFLS